MTRGVIDKLKGTIPVTITCLVSTANILLASETSQLTQNVRFITDEGVKLVEGKISRTVVSDSLRKYSSSSCLATSRLLNPPITTVINTFKANYSG